MQLACQTDLRRDAVRAAAGRNGLDYVELSDDQRSLHVYFLGKLPPELLEDGPALPAFFAVEGGDVATGIQVLDADPVADPDPERDDFVVLRLDRAGDFSTYTLRLVGVAGIDPFYASVDFSFKIGCPSDLDCRAACGCEPELPDEPQLNYLAKDYESFRQLIFDRMALKAPGWTERHVPDLGVTLVELLAYVGDHLSYQQDAVATEAYLGTARQRISVRRHARLVDYRLHEGHNARAWLHVGVSADTPPLLPSQLAFITPHKQNLEPQDRLLKPEQLASLPASSYEWFEPLVADATQPLQWYAAHNRIEFYTWGRRECCLPAGTTRATLRDPGRSLRLQTGDVLIFEEVLGAHTGDPADADPGRRCAVRLTRVEAAEDSLYPVEAEPGEGDATGPSLLQQIEWAAEDALPFALCLSALGRAPDCAYLEPVSVARGNVLLVDHGRSFGDETVGPVPGRQVGDCCDCEGQPADPGWSVGRFRPRLQRGPITHREPLPALPAAASRSTLQDPRRASAALWLSEGEAAGGAVWTARPDLLASSPDERDFVCEIDNQGLAQLRFGDGELGRQPTVGSVFTVHARTGSGTAGNVGPEAIACVVLSGLTLDGIQFTPRNPLPASGGLAPEPMAEAQLYAPLAFRKQLLRAITAGDYAALAQADPRLQRAACQLVWTGSWYEADVGIDPLAGVPADEALLGQIEAALHRVRRMGHDLRVQPAAYVPITLKLEACALPGYDRGHVKAALLERFSARRGASGALGFFHPDRLSFGEGIYLSQLIAAAVAVPGVECATVSEFHRAFEAANGEIENGVLPLAPHEIAQLAGDPNHPERGQLDITVRGGR